MFNYDPNINYSEYKMRMCGYNWEYCDGKCNSCAKRNITYSTNIDIIPLSYKTTTSNVEQYKTKNYDYTIDYLHKDSTTIPFTSISKDNHRIISIDGIDKELYCQTIGPWSYYREQYGWKSDLL